MNEGCQRVKAQNVIERYIDEKLSVQEAEAFEKHYLGCSNCFSALELTHAEALRLVAKRSAVSVPEAGRFAGKRTVWQWALGSSIAVVLLVLVLVRPWSVPTDLPRQSSALPAALPDSAVLEQMAILDPASPPPRQIRGSETADGLLRFQEGIQAYAAENYTNAIARFSEALRLNPGHRPSVFYLGMACLVSGHNDDAIQQLSSLISPDSPYVEDSHWYMAQAYLKKRDAAKAKTELQEVVKLNDVRSTQAQAMLDRIEKAGF